MKLYRIYRYNPKYKLWNKVIEFSDLGAGIRAARIYIKGLRSLYTANKFKLVTFVSKGKPE